MPELGSVAPVQMCVRPVVMSNLEPAAVVAEGVAVVRGRPVDGDVKTIQATVITAIVATAHIRLVGPVGAAALEQPVEAELRPATRHRSKATTPA